MMKSFNKAISIFLVAVFILSLVPVGAFAEVTIPSSYQNPGDKPWVGSNVPNCSFYYYDSTNAVNQNTTSVSGKKTNASEMAYSDGTFGKPSGDMVYLLRDSIYKDQDADLTQHGSYFNVGLTQPTSVDVRTSDFAVEFSFAMTDSKDRISILTPMYTDYSKAKSGASSGTSGNALYFNITPTSASIAGVTTTFANPLSLNRWYNAVAVYDICADSTGINKQSSYIYKLFINSELYAQTSTTKSYYGPRYVRMGTASLGNSENATPDNWVHYDNIDSFVIPSDASDSYAPTKPTASTLTSSDSAIEFIDTTIAAPETYTVGDLRKALAASKPNDVIKFYNSDYSAIKTDSAPAINTNVVIASLQDGIETTFSYYAVEKWVKKFPGINIGTTKFDKGGSSGSYWRMESINTGLGGKADDDSFLLYADSSGDPYQSVSVAPATGDRDVLEMQVYVPKGAKDISFNIGMYDQRGAGEYTEMRMLMRDDGLYTNYGNGPGKMFSWEADKWNTLALVSPKPYTGAVDSDGNSLDSTYVDIYLNGILSKSQPTTYSTTGFRHIRFSSSIKSLDEVCAYFDNIRVHSNPYEPQYDALAQISYKDGIDEDNNITVKGAITVAELKAGITKADDTNIRVMRSLTSTEVLSDGETIRDGDIVVAAAMNNSEMERSYNYYTIDRIKQEVKINTLVNDEAGRLYKETDKINVNTAYTNYSDEPQNVIMYTAQYKNGELIKLWQTAKTTVAAGTTANLDCDFTGIEKYAGSSIKVMVVNPDTLAPYTDPATMRFNNEDTKTTLYLLGDSIVQEYVDVGYPIQGWGKYIGKYLNGNITVENRATSGWTTDHYLYPDGVYTRYDGVTEYGTELTTTKGSKKTVGASNRHKIWSNILSELKEGDFVMVSLGINDSGSGNVPEDRYLENITTIYNEATAKGATVVFSTPTISGKDWNNIGGFGESWGGSGKICAEFAKSKGTVCIPLGATLVKKYNAMVDSYLVENPDKAKKDACNYVRNYFHMYGASGTIRDGIEGFGSLITDDSTHHNYLASEEIAGIIADLFKNSDSPLGDYVK